MGRKGREEQQPLWINASGLASAPGHPFYEELNAVLAARGFDDFVEEKCARFYAPTMGRPSIPPGVYFRALMIGYFERIESERGIAWRCADSLALRRFLGYALDRMPPDHSSISRTRRKLDLETHEDVFGWALRALADEGLLSGKTMGIDATTLEANAALRSIVRRDTGEGYREFLVGLARESGIETPTREDLAKIDRKRKRKGSNDDWTSPSGLGRRDFEDAGRVSARRWSDASRREGRKDAPLPQGRARGGHGLGRGRGVDAPSRRGRRHRARQRPTLVRRCRAGPRASARRWRRRTKSWASWRPRERSSVRVSARP